MSCYIEVELFGRVLHEVPVSDDQSEAESSYRRARADWKAGRPVAVEAGGVRLASYFADDVTGLRLRPFEERVAA
jgi:hypothetical protein